MFTGEIMSITHDQAEELRTQQQLLLGIGEGAIDPDTRIARGDISRDTVDDVCEALKSEELYDHIAANDIPRMCVDGRHSQDGPCAAGGTFSLVIADALANNRYRQSGETAAEHATRYYQELTAVGQKIGGHDDDHQHGPFCGCGAQDKLDARDDDQPSILRYIAEKGDNVRSVLATLGVQVPDKLHTNITNRALDLRKEHYASSGKELRDVTQRIGGLDSIETVHGGHNEVVAVINMRAGTTLNRTKLRESYGDSMQVFNLDVVNLQKGTEYLALSTKEAAEQFIAALYFNVAALAVLAGPSLRIVVRD
jgi:hypothetical protein